MPIPIFDSYKESKRIFTDEDLQKIESTSTTYANASEHFKPHTRFNSKGELYFQTPHRIWKLKPFNPVVEVAGNGLPGFKDGKGAEAQFRFPTAMAFDAADNLYVADTGNHAIRKITPDGVVTTVYKNPE